MALQSMTGFARAGAELNGTAIAWEVKSVNGKGIEARLRLPPGFERIEQPARQAMQKRFSRGNVQATLTVVQAGQQTQPVVNEEFLKDLAGLAAAPGRGVRRRAGQRRRPAGPARRAGRARDTVESDEVRAATDAVILAAFDAALAGLEQARRSEGAALEAILRGHLDRIEALTRAGRSRSVARTGRHPPASRRPGPPAARRAPTASTKRGLNMEAACLATKADIREELDRLAAHVASARALLAGGGADRPQARFPFTGIQPRIEYVCARNRMQRR